MTVAFPFAPCRVQSRGGGFCNTSSGSDLPRLALHHLLCFPPRAARFPPKYLPVFLMSNH